MDYINTKKLLITCSLTVTSLIFSGCGGSSSSDSSSSTQQLLINEFKSNIAEDVHSKQYIELRGKPNEVIKDTYLVVLDGDNGEEGKVDYAYNLNGVKVGSNGLIILKNENEYNDVVSNETTIINDPAIRTYDPDVDGDEFEDGILEHDAVTYMLIKTTDLITRGDDLDNNNDGVLDISTDKILDSVGNHDGGDGYVYSNIILEQSASDADAATRFYENLTANSIDAWANGDIYEDPNKEDEELASEVLYDTLQASSNLPPKAKLTPGKHNFKQAPFALINEVVLSGNRYIELLSNAAQSFKNVYLISVGPKGVINMAIDLNDVTAKETGITIIKDANSIILTGLAIESIDADLSVLDSNGTSLLLVYSKNLAITTNMDFDIDDNGKIEFPEELILLDNIGLGNTTYSDVLNNNSTTAIRYKDNKMASASAWSFDTNHSTPANTNIAETAKVLVKPIIETARTTQENPDADDIAFWIHPTDSTKSLIIATQKKAGYSIYNTDGETLADVNPGNIRFNNVDVIYNYNMNGTSIDLAFFTDRITNKFAIYQINETAPYMIDLTDYSSNQLFDAQEVGEDTAYGQAVYNSLVNPGEVYAYATRNGYNEAKKFKLKTVGNKIGWDEVAKITLAADDEDKHAEGMVVDQEYGKLYIAQEEVGIYTLDAELTDDITLTEDDLILEEGDNGLVSDLEGVTIYYKDNGTGYFFISSQGNNTFGVFDRTNLSTKNTYKTSFTIVDDMNGIDGVQETDSIDVTNFAISAKFPYGAFIAQDGIDTTIDPDDIKTNFKWVKWEDIASKLGDVTFSSNYNPRNPTNRR